MMIKLESLYFKLNPENPKHKFIIDFFNTNKCINKIDLLYNICWACTPVTEKKDN